MVITLGGGLVLASCTTNLDDIFVRASPGTGGEAATGSGGTGLGTTTGTGGAAPEPCEPGDLPDPPESGPLLCGDCSACPQCGAGGTTDVACTYACDACGCDCPLALCPTSPPVAGEATSCIGRCSQDTTCALICDSDDCDFTCDQCTAAEYECNGFDCLASCRGATTCQLECGASQCALHASSSTASLACDVPTVTPCQQLCDDGSACTITSLGEANVFVEGASATVTCGNPQAPTNDYCDVRCRESSSCQATCHSVDDCRFECEAGSSCALRCPQQTASACSASLTCPDRATPVGCGDGWFACGAEDCP